MSIDAFRANLADVTGQPAAAGLIDPQQVHSEELRQRMAAKIQEELLGLPGGSVISVSGRANSDAHLKSAKQLAERQSALARAANDVALWVALIQQGELDAYIAEQMFGGMSDQEIMELAEQIEAETGKSVEQWAEELLGEDVPERRPHESDADYKQRLLEAITEELLGEDGQILPEYQDHPLSRIIIEPNEVYQRAKPIAAEAVQMMADGASLEDATQHLEEAGLVDGGLGSEFASAAAGDQAELKTELREDRDVGRGKQLGNENDIADNSATLDLFG